MSLETETVVVVVVAVAVVVVVDVVVDPGATPVTHSSRCTKRRFLDFAYVIIASS